MALVLTERFIVNAPLDRVWSYLTNPREVVACMPGAELSMIDDDGSFHGQIRVKVGPMMMGYTGTARFDELDHAAHRARLVATAREAAGSGTAAMTMTSTVVEALEGGTEVRIHASVDLTGKIVQFGRGLLDDVSRQIIRQFAGCVQSTLDVPPEGAPPVHAEPVTTRTPSVPGRATDRRPSVEALPMVRGALWRTFVRWFRRLVGRGDPA
ncbi:MAG TPA: SRPBCC family protein [Gemmatimonadaceae bacterium]|nr:SRPBCC family protein [Gemmatimonadaceae bacterium]